MSKAAHLAVQSSPEKCPIILDLHENFPDAILSYKWTHGTIRNLIIKPKAWQKKELEYLQYADKIIVLSNLFKDELFKKYPLLKKNNIVEYTNLIDIEVFNKTENNSKEKKHTLLYFGVVAERRGIFNAILSIKNLIEKGHKLTLLVIGPVDKSDQKQFQQLITSSELKNAITYIPWIPLHDLPKHMKMSEICLAPFIKNKQHDSGVANKIYQYMYGKKPIIASNCTPQKRLIENSKCGLIYSTQEELEKSILDLCYDKEKSTELGVNGYNTLISLLDSNTSLKKLYSEFTSALK